MAKKKQKVLGRGLSNIIPKAETRSNISNATNVPIDQIEPNPYQPRKEFDHEELQELADSIKEYGIIQPLTLRKLNVNKYQIIAGERRLRAAKLAGLKEVPAFVKDTDDDGMLAMALIENIQRSNLNPIEVALGYQRLIEECNLTIEQAAQKVGKKRATVNNFLRLLKLPPEIQLALQSKQISMGHAKPLITIDDPIFQLKIYKKIIDEKLSVRDVEKLVKEYKDDKKQKAKPKKQLTPEEQKLKLYIKDIKQQLERQFNTKVSLSINEKGEGEIKLKFFSQEDLNRLLELLQ